MGKRVIKKEALFCGFAFHNLRDRKKILRFYDKDKLIMEYFVLPNESIFDYSKPFGCILFTTPYITSSLKVLAGTKYELTIHEADLKDMQERWNTFRF